MKDKLKSVIGLQIFTNELRAVEISGNSARVRVLAHGSIPLDDGTILEGLIVKPELFMQRLTELFKKGGFKAAHIVVEVACGCPILRQASFPKVTEDKQDNVILLQAQDFIPIPLSELEISHIITGETEDENGVFVNALLVGMDKNIITTLVDTIQNRRYGGYIVNSITIGVTAVTDQVSKQTSAQTYMVAYLNNDTLDIVIITGGDIAMARSIQLDPAITAELNKHSLNPEYGNIPEELHDYVVNELRDEYLISANYYHNKNPNEISKLYAYSPVVDFDKSIRQVGADFDIEAETVSLSGRLSSSGKFSTDKYLGCVCVAAMKL